MQTLADMRGVGVKNQGKNADVLCGRPLGRYDILYPQFKVPIQIMLLTTQVKIMDYFVQGGQILFVRILQKIIDLYFDEKISPAIKVCVKFMLFHQEVKK